MPVEEGPSAARPVDTESYVVAIARLLTELMGPGQLDDLIPRVLQRLGRLMRVDRVYLFENDELVANKPPSVSQRFEWARDVVVPQIDNPGLQNLPYDSFSERWYPVLSAGGVIVGDVEDFPQDERNLLEPQDIISILIVPVSIDGEFWGFVGFDACTERREFGELEVEVLRATSQAIAMSFRSRRREARLRLTAAVFESTRDAIVVLNRNGRVEEMNRSFREQFKSCGEPLGRLIEEVVCPLDEHRDVFPVLRDPASNMSDWQGEFSFQRPAGALGHAWLTVSRIVGDRPGVTRTVAVFTDIGPLKRSEERLKYLSEHDPLTGLPNRLALQREMLDRIGREESFSVLFMDLDRFKNVNDSLGHPEGDRLLVALAERTLDAIPKGAYLARIGGDEFIVLLPSGVDRTVSRALAWEILQLHTSPYELDSKTIFSTVSIGLASFPEDSEHPDELIQFADAALFQAKRSGRARICVYDPELTERARGRLEMEMALRHAVRKGELEPWFQPQFRLSDGAMVGAELLLRWRTESGDVSPTTFIPIAEETGCIAELTSETIRAAASRWSELSRRAGRPLRLAVNLSAAQFHRYDVIDVVRAAKTDFGLPEGALELELTESTLIEEPRRVRAMLESLRNLGVRVAIDDFGSGYSSLAVLRSYPIDHLKIDKLFVDDIHSESGQTLVSTIISMGRALGMDVSAEGVESSQQAALLVDLGCNYAQGFHLGMPQPFESLVELVDAERLGANERSTDAH